MNEDMIAYDVFTKEFVSSTKIMSETNNEKVIDTTTYTTIATIFPKLKGQLAVNVHFTGSGDGAIAVYDDNNTLIVEESGLSSEKNIRLTFNITQALNKYEIKARKTKSYGTLTSNRIQLQGEVRDKGSFYVPLVEA